MATKIKKILKRDLVTVEEGRNLGRATDIRIEPDKHRIELLVLATGSVPDASLVVHAASVRSFETDKIAIDNLDALKVAAQDEDALGLLNRGLHFTGREVVSSTGQRLGKIANVLVDADGLVTEYRLRKGLRGILWPAVKVTPAQLGTAGVEIAVAGGDAAD